MRHCLYKYFSQRNWAERFVDGELLFRSLSYFRDYKDQIRGDRNEGSSIFSPENGLVINNETQGKTTILLGHAFESTVRQDEIFVFCLSRTFTQALSLEFEAVCCVEIQDIRQFCTRIKEAL